MDKMNQGLDSLCIKKVMHLETLLKAATVGITDSGHDIANCEGPKECYLCQVQTDIEQYFEN